MSKELSKFNNPTAIIAIIVSFSYVVGWVYAQAYFSRLGILHESLNLPALFYLSHAQLPLLRIFLASIIIILFRMYYVKKHPISRPSTTTHKVVRLVALSIIFLFTSLALSSNLGVTHAIHRIEGDSDNIFTINFSWKENPLSEIEGKELILIIHSEGKYYVVEKQKPAPEFPEVYIIPDEQVKFAVVKKIPHIFYDIKRFID